MWLMQESTFIVSATVNGRLAIFVIISGQYFPSDFQN